MKSILLTTIFTFSCLNIAHSQECDKTFSNELKPEISDIEMHFTPPKIEDHSKLNAWLQSFYMNGIDSTDSSAQIMALQHYVFYELINENNKAVFEDTLANLVFKANNLSFKNVSTLIEICEEENFIDISIRKSM